MPNPTEPNRSAPNRSAPSPAAPSPVPSVTVESGELEALLRAAFAARGQVDDPAARMAAAAIVEAERVGMPEFGLALALGALESAEVRWGEPPVAEDHGGAVVLDAEGRFAPIVLAQAALIASERAGEAGVGIVAVTSPGSLGRIAPFARAVADRGLLGVIAVGSPPLVAPHGGRAPALGTNPVATAIPSSTSPVVVDTSSSLLTKGRWGALRERGERVPEGVAIDAEGQPTTDAELVRAFLPRGGAFGTAMGIVVEMVVNGLTGLLGSSRERRGATVMAMRSLAIDAPLVAVGDDLRQRLEAAGGYVPGSAAPTVAGPVAVAAVTVERLRRLVAANG